MMIIGVAEEWVREGKEYDALLDPHTGRTGWSTKLAPFVRTFCQGSLVQYNRE